MLSQLGSSFDGEVDTSPFVRRCYAGAAGIYAQRPRAVAFPLHADDVRRAVRFCVGACLPLTARGAGSGMAGNNVGRGLVLDVTRHMTAIGAYDEESGRVWVQPGATYREVNDFLRPYGRFLPPNPSSGAFCTLGGMLANNASGMRSVKYGACVEWVDAVRGVWGTGDAFLVGRGRDQAAADGVLLDLERVFRRSLPQPPVWWSRVAKNSSGLRVWNAWDGSNLDAVELLAGSEGTLAVFTELLLRSEPLPGGRALLLASFRTLDDLASAVEILRPRNPSGAEFLDRTFLEPLRLANPLARGAVPVFAEAVLFAELEAGDEDQAAEAARSALHDLRDLVLPGAVVAASQQEAETLWRIRRGASPALRGLHPGRTSLQFVEDCAVPAAALQRLLAGLRRIFDRAGIPVVLFGHAGESHVHANPLFDLNAPDVESAIERIAGEVCDLVDELSGTLSGEHGDGLARAEFARRRYGAAVDFFAEVRGVCDPAGVLNPGKILPAPGWRTSRDLRHPWERRLLAARARRRSGASR